MVKFNWVTDSHIQEIAQERDDNLAAAVADCDNWPCDFFINTGDAGNDEVDSVKKAWGIMRAGSITPHVAIGNHDEIENVPGTPLTTEIEAADAFNRLAPFYYSVSHDTALLLFLDCNFFGGVSNATHNTGDRIGHNLANTDFNRQLGATQLAWVSSQLSASAAIHICVFIHYNPHNFLTDHESLTAILNSDGRQYDVFCGHRHPDGNDEVDGISTWHKAPALLESGAWARVVVTEQGLESAIVRNYTNPGGWAIVSPFKERVSTRLMISI